MADLDIERKGKGSALPWIIGLLVLVLLLFLFWPRGREREAVEETVVEVPAAPEPAPR